MEEHGSWVRVKDQFIIHRNNSSQHVFIFSQFPQAPIPIQWHKEDQGTPTMQSVVLGEKPQVLETQMFYNGLQAHLYKMCHGGRHYIY